MPISGRIVAGWTASMLALGLSALAAIVVAALWLNTRAEMHLSEALEATELRQSAEGLWSALLAAESSQRGYILTGNEIYLSPYDSAQIKSRDEMDRIRGFLNKNRQKAQLVDQLSNVVEAKLKEMQALIRLKSEQKDDEVLSIFNTNAGKSLMDETNIYLTGISLDSDERVEAGIREQSRNAVWLRTVTFLAAMLIVAVSIVTAVIVRSYAADIVAARNTIAAANANLEHRVNERTAELSKARDLAEMLLAEVNHRVSNSLSLVISLIRLQLRSTSDGQSRQVLEQTATRIQAIAQMHKTLFTSGSIGDVSVDQYLGAVMKHLIETVGAERGGIRLSWKFDPIVLNTTEAIHCGIIATEWVTNAYKYAYPDGDGEIRVRLIREDGSIVLSVEDDGIGFDKQEPTKGTGLGSRIVQAIASQMRARAEHIHHQPGLTARLTLALEESVTWRPSAGNVPSHA